MSVTAFSRIQYFSRSWMTETDTRWILTALFWDVLFFLRWVLSEMRGRRWGGVQQWELQSFARRRNRWEKLARGGWIPVKKKVRAERDRQHVRHTLLPLSLRPPHSLASLSLQPFSLFSPLILPSPILKSPLLSPFSHQIANIRVFALLRVW